METGSIISKGNLSNSLQAPDNVFDMDYVVADDNPDLFSFAEDMPVNSEDYISCSDIAALLFSQFGIDYNKVNWDDLSTEKRNELISSLIRMIITNNHCKGNEALLMADIIILLYSNVVKSVGNICAEANKTSFDYISAVNFLVNAWLNEENTPVNVYGFIINKLSLAGSTGFDSSFLFSEKGGGNQ